jgi:hypothetical protein
MGLAAVGDRLRYRDRWRLGCCCARISVRHIGQYCGRRHVTITEPKQQPVRGEFGVTRRQLVTGAAIHRAAELQA